MKARWQKMVRLNGNKVQKCAHASGGGSYGKIANVYNKYE